MTITVGGTTRQQDEAIDRVLERHAGARVTAAGPMGVSAILVTPLRRAPGGPVAAGATVRVLPDGQVLDPGAWAGQCRGGTIRWRP